MADVALVPQRHILQRRGDIAPHHAGEAGNAQAAAAVANVEDAKVQLTAEVANAYVNLREAQSRAKAYRTECELQRSEEHTSELQSLMRISYAVFCLKKKTIYVTTHIANHSFTPYYNA